MFFSLFRPSFSMDFFRVILSWFSLLCTDTRLLGGYFLSDVVYGVDWHTSHSTLGY
ncbi:MAG: hypothetical protein K2O60_06450 [Ruminococcus sp.]|nr:hypothetical protein [Ruminococcus sp.]